VTIIEEDESLMTERFVIPVDIKDGEENKPPTFR